MNASLKRLMALARRTGDRLIVTDPDGEDVFVLMGVEQYEMLLGGEKVQDKKDQGPKKNQESTGEETKNVVWEEPVVEKVVRTIPVKDEASVQPPPTPPSKGGEVVGKIPDVAEATKVEEKPSETSADDFGEEQFYLEPIE